MIFKSLAFGVFGAALFFAFFGMILVPALAAWARVHNPNAPLQAQDVVIQPLVILQYVGLPLAAATFLLCSYLGHKKFSRAEPTS